jgi:hypothetical protein
MISRFGYTFEGGNFWLSAGGGTVFFPGYQPRYGVPVYGSGLRIDRIIAPTLAQRITVDLGGSPVAGIIQLLGPEDSAAAASDPGGDDRPPRRARRWVSTLVAHRARLRGSARSRSRRLRHRP